MKFIINKELKEGRYFVMVGLVDFDDSDLTKANKFGFPRLIIKHPNTGKDIKVKINGLSQYAAYGFYNQTEADEYAENLKNQIKELKQRWSELKDQWSDEEVL